MKKIQKNQGITLVALVVTIIVLLILAGVSLSLVAGSDGILNKAVKAVDKNEIAMIQEKVELKVAEEVENFYEAKYVNYSIDNSYVALDYLRGKDTTEDTTARRTIKEGNAEYTIDYIPKTENGATTYQISVNYTNGSTKWHGNPSDANTKKVNELVGTISENGVINWNGQSENTGGTQNPDKGDSISIDVSNYGDYLDLGTNLLTETTLEDGSAILADWRIFYEENGTTWAILADYLPNTKNPSRVIKKNTYAIRHTLVGYFNALLNEEVWKGLLNGSMIKENENVNVKGAFSLNEWVKSWNAKGYPQLYIANNGINKYYVGLEENPTTDRVSYENLDSSKDNLYFPRTSEYKKCYGYWLDTNGPVRNTYTISYLHGLLPTDDASEIFGCRPAVSFPTSLLKEKKDGIWVID